MKTLYIYGLLAVVSFVFHFVWESSHLSLYGGYEGLSGSVPITLWATLGDVRYTFGAVLLVALFKKSLVWFQSVRITDYAGLFILGIFIAVFVEYKAFVFDRWFYLNTMPIIPGLNVGLSPVLQMALLLPLSVFVVNRYMHRLHACHTTGRSRS